MISFAAHLTQRIWTYTQWAAVRVLKDGNAQYDDDGTMYLIWFYDANEVHVCHIWKGVVPHGVIATYSQEQNDSDKSLFESTTKPIANSTLLKQNSYGVPLVSGTLRAGAKVQIISQNFCDNRTWYSTSIRRTAVSMVCDVAGTLWTLPVDKVGVDVTHARILHERRLWTAHRPVVKVNGVTKTEVNPHDAVGDYMVDYHTMRVTFTTPHLGDTVTLDYSEVVNSKWYLAPAPGRLLRLVKAELQFSTDARLKDTFMFQARADVAKFPPLAPYWDANGGPYPAGTMLPLGDPVYYQSIMDLITEANLAYPVIPKTIVGTPNWRDLTQDVMIYAWDYENQATIDLSSSLGMDIEIKLEHDVVCDGLAGIVTFYCLSESEPATPVMPAA